MKPDARGYFGDFGGRYVPEVLIAALDEACPLSAVSQSRQPVRELPSSVLAFAHTFRELSGGWGADVPVRGRAGGEGS